MPPNPAAARTQSATTGATAAPTMQFIAPARSSNTPVVPARVSQPSFTSRPSAPFKSAAYAAPASAPSASVPQRLPSPPVPRAPVTAQTTAPLSMFRPGAQDATLPTVGQPIYGLPSSPLNAFASRRASTPSSQLGRYAAFPQETQAALARADAALIRQGIDPETGRPLRRSRSPPRRDKSRSRSPRYRQRQ